MWKKNNPWLLILLSPFYPVFKAIALTGWSHDPGHQYLGDCLTVVCSGPLGAAGHWYTMRHKHSMSWICAKGTSGPFSRKLPSLELTFDQRWAIFMTGKPNSYHPVGWHNIPFQSLHTGQDNALLFHKKHSNSELQITPSPSQRICLYGTFSLEPKVKTDSHFKCTPVAIFCWERWRALVTSIDLN